MVFLIKADASGAITEVNRTASAVQNLQTATAKDFSSGLVRALEKAETEAKLLTGQISKADVEIQKFQRRGASDEMVSRLRATQENVAKIAREQAAAETRLRAIREENVRHNRQQQQLIAQQVDARVRREDQAITRQITLQEQAAAIKASLMTREQFVAQEMVKLQEMRNRGLITELELQGAIANVRARSRTMAGPGGQGAMMAGMIAQQGAVGLQDAVSGYQTNGVRGAIMAGGNNIIQMVSLINPAAGAAAALTVAAVQLGASWLTAKDAAKESKEAFDSAKESIRGVLDLNRQIAQSRGERSPLLEAKVQAQGEAEIARTEAEGIRQRILNEQRQGGVNGSFSKEQWARWNAMQAEAGIADEKANAADFKALEFGMAAADGTTKGPLIEKQEAQNILLMAAKETAEANERAAEKKKKEEEEILEIIRKEQEVQRDITNARTAAAKAVRDALRSPEQRTQDEADRLLRLQANGDLEMSDVRQTISRMLQGTMGGPQIAQGLVRGSVEEVRARRLDEAKTAQDRMVEKQTEALVEARSQTEELRQIREKVAGYPPTGEAA